MAPICSICCDKQINYICKCNTCKKSLCLDCYDRIIIRTNNETYNYKCPFCTSENEKEIEELQPKQIIKLCDRNINSDIQQIIEKNIELIEQNHIIIDENDNYRDLIMNLEKILENNKAYNREITTQLYIVKNKKKNYKELKKTIDSKYQKLILDYHILLKENEKLKASIPIPEVKIKKINKYQEYIKENFKTFKNDNPDITHQKIFKLLASKWKIKK
jgi:hypothetical protein